MTTPEELHQRHENNLQGIIQVSVLAADMWALDNDPWTGSRAEYARGLINTAIRHAIEQGLLELPEDIGRVLSEPISMRRSTDSEPT